MKRTTYYDETPEGTAKWLFDAGAACQGDGQVSCLRCGAELDRDAAEELAVGLCGDDRDLRPYGDRFDRRDVPDEDRYGR